MIGAILDELAPNLVARNSIGQTGAAQLLLAAATTQSACARRPACSPMWRQSRLGPASGKTVQASSQSRRYRAANRALHIIAIGRLRTEQRTKDYVARRIAEGHSKLDAIRALKRYLAREVFTLIMQRQKEINATRIAAAASS